MKKIKIILGTEFEHLAVEEFINKFYSNGLKQINDDFFESETTFATLTLSNRLEQDHDLQIKITPSITDPRENLKLEFSLATTRYSTFFQRISQFEKDILMNFIETINRYSLE